MIYFTLSKNNKREDKTKLKVSKKKIANSYPSNSLSDSKVNCLKHVSAAW